MSNEVPTPENKTPILWCERCKRMVRHNFSHKEPATANEGDTSKNLIFTCGECLEPRRFGRERE